MRTLTINEVEYLEKLMDRNCSEDYKGSLFVPLKTPMDIQERKLRSRIRRKLETYLQDIPCIVLAGIRYKNIHSYNDIDQKREHRSLMLIADDLGACIASEEEKARAREESKSSAG
jgi:hypothetical protein